MLTWYCASDDKFLRYRILILIRYLFSGTFGCWGSWSLTRLYGTWKNGGCGDLFAWTSMGWHLLIFVWMLGIGYWCGCSVGLKAPVYFCSGCMEVFGGFCWNIFLILTLYIATAWISLLFIDSNSFRGLALNCSPAVIHLELPGVWIRWILLAIRSSLFSGLACCWISFSIHCLLIESCGLTWSCWWKVACL